jgi:branched-chain amino acid transport system permease protein
MLARARDNIGWPSIVLLVLLALTPLVVTDVTNQSIVVLAMIYAVGAVGLDLLTGYSGQFSFGQFVYFAIGAYVMASLRYNEHWSWVPAVIAGVVAATVVATVIGALFARLRFFGSAVGTFFLGAVAVDLLSGKRLQHWTGGSNGLTVPPVSIGSTSLNAGNGLYFSALIALTLSVLLCLRYTKVRAGLAARVVKENEVVAAVMGIRVFREKIRAQAIAGAVAGLGGCILAFDIGYLSPDTFNVTQSIELFAIVAVGGTGSLAGAIIGSLFFFSATNALSSTSASSSQLLFAIILLAVVILLNRGLYDLGEQLIRRAVRLIRRQAPATEAPESAVPTPPVVLDDDLAALFSPTDSELTGSKVPATPEPAETLLEVVDAGVEFGGVAALSGVSFEVRRGEVHAIIGPNGAGKTTLLNCISGIQPMSGRVTLAGHDLSGLSVSQRRGEGIARTFQHPSLVGDLNVLQNVEIGAFERQSGSMVLELLGGRRSRRLRRVAHERAIGALERLAFPHERWSAPAGDLTMGEQKHVDIARAIGSQPKLLLLDEPTSGLGSEEMAAVASAIDAVRAAGVTVLVIAHHVGFIRQIADRCTVLDFGQVLTSGTAADVLVDERVVDVFVGAGGKTPPAVEQEQAMSEQVTSKHSHE